MPKHLRDSHTAFNRSEGNGADYIYNHDCPGAISGQDYMENPKTFYRPTSRGAEKLIAGNGWKSIKNSKEKLKNGKSQ